MGNIRKILVIGIVSVCFLIIAAVLLSMLSFGFFRGGQVAVIPVKGEITASTQPFSGGLSAWEIVERIEQAEADPSVSAILFDIDSPGGSAVATKQIVYKIRNAEKPTVAYIGELGASGGYYVAAATDYIVADGDSLTGSIGVISIVPNIEELLEKIGVKVKIVKEGEMKAMGSMFVDMTPEEENMLKKIMRDTFEGFKSDVMSFRKGKLNEERFSSIADGRILSGRQALELNLIDETGVRERAVEKAAQLGGISGKPALKYYPKEGMSLFDFFAGAGYSFAGALKAALLPPETIIKV